MSRPPGVVVPALIGIVAQIAFTAVWLIAPAWQVPDYSVRAHSISDMYATDAPRAWIIIVVFTLAGLATWVLIWGALRRVLPSGMRMTITCVVLSLSIFGLGDVLTPFERLACQRATPGCSAEDQLATAGGTMDATLSNVGVILLILGVFLTAFHFRHLAWRGAFLGSLIAGILLIVCVVGLAAAPEWGGLFERGVALVGAVWFAGVAWFVAFAPRPTAPAPLSGS